MLTILMRAGVQVMLRGTGSAAAQLVYAAVGLAGPYMLVDTRLRFLHQRSLPCSAADGAAGHAKND